MVRWQDREGDKSGGLPVPGQDGVQFALFETRQSGEHVFQVFPRVQPVAVAGADYTVDHGAAPASLRVADEKPVLFPYGAGPDRVFG